jgi:hypothetical protein
MTTASYDNHRVEVEALLATRFAGPGIEAGVAGEDVAPRNAVADQLPRTVPGSSWFHEP